MKVFETFASVLYLQPFTWILPQPNTKCLNSLHPLSARTSVNNCSNISSDTIEPNSINLLKKLKISSRRRDSPQPQTSIVCSLMCVCASVRRQFSLGRLHFYPIFLRLVPMKDKTRSLTSVKGKPCCCRIFR